MTAALASWHMGKVIRAFRMHPWHGQPISQATAGAWLQLNQTQLSRLETGPAVTDLAKLRHWARVLGIPADLLWFKLPDGPAEPASACTTQRDETDAHALAQPAASPRPGGLLVPIMVDGHAVLVPIDSNTMAASGLNALLDELRLDGCAERLAAIDGDVMSPPNRRSLLTHGLAAAALPAFGLDEVGHVVAALEDARRHFDGSVVDYFRRQLEVCMADDGRLGPKQTLPTVLGILEAVSANARDVKPAVRRDLLSLGARGAEFAGWLYRDLGHPGPAGYWYDRATEWAQEAGDLPMQGYILLKRSQMAYDERDAVRVLTLAQAAQHGPWQLPATVKAEVTQQEARGLAMIGQPLRLVEQKLEDARHLLVDTEAQQDQAGQLSVYFNDGTLTLRTASCYIEAGKPQQASTLYRQVLSADLLSRRDRGYFMARLASSLALAGEPDDAAAAGLESIQLAAATSSQRTKRELGRALKTLRPWRSRPGPRELREALSA